jgi:hypothetical protein
VDAGRDRRHGDGEQSRDARNGVVDTGGSVIGGITAFVTIRTGADVAHQVLPGINHACQDPSTRRPRRAPDAA